MSDKKTENGDRRPETGKNKLFFSLVAINKSYWLLVTGYRLND